MQDKKRIKLEYEIMSMKTYDFTKPAVKKDDAKPRFELIPANPMKSVANVFSFGAVKYGDHNWKNGMKWSRLLGALERHVNAYKSGETQDPETNESHLAHAVANCLMLMEMEKIGNEWNDIH